MLFGSPRNEENLLAVPVFPYGLGFLCTTTASSSPPCVALIGAETLLSSI